MLWACNLALHGLLCIHKKLSCFMATSVCNEMNELYYLLLPAGIKMPTHWIDCAYPLVTFNLMYQSMWFNFNSSTLLLFHCIAFAIVLHAYTKGTTQDLISSPPIPYTIFFGPVILLTKLSKRIGRTLSIRVQKFFVNRFSIMYVHVSQCMYMYMTGRHN